MLIKKVEKLNNPIISVIIAVFNAKDSIERTILSVVNQTYKNIELIIIDGGSTDGTMEIINHYTNSIKVLISEPDDGVYDAMNKGCGLVTGDWVYFIGAGDILFNVLHKIIPFFNEDTVVYGDVYKLDELKIYDGSFNSFKLAVKNICHQAIFYPSKILEQFKYNLKFKLQADYDLNIRLYGKFKNNFKYIPVVICAYEGDGLSATTIDRTFFNEKLAIIKANFSTSVYFYALLRNRTARLINKNHWSKI